MPIKPYLCTLGTRPVSKPKPEELVEGNSDAILRLTLLSDAPHHHNEARDESGDYWTTFMSEVGEHCLLCHAWIHAGWVLFPSVPHLRMQHVCNSHVETRLPETPLLLMVDD